MKPRSLTMMFIVTVIICCSGLGWNNILSPLQAPSLYAMSGKPKEFPIRLKVDFGPAGKPAHEEKLYVEKGTTPKEAVSQVFPILSGKTCCSFREIMEINGVRVDPAKNRWWVCAVNGSRNISPSKKKLKPGDAVEWKFVEEAQ